MAIVLQAWYEGRRIELKDTLSRSFFARSQFLINPDPKVGLLALHFEVPRARPRYYSRSCRILDPGSLSDVLSSRSWRIFGLPAGRFRPTLIATLASPPMGSKVTPRVSIIALLHRSGPFDLGQPANGMF